jgi:hypothetical protein
LFNTERGPKLFTTISGPEMVDIVREMGFLPELDSDGRGDPLIRFRIEGLRCIIGFYGVKEGRSNSIQFRAWFSEKLPLEKVNEWNLKKRFGKAALDGDGDLSIEMNVDLDGGVTDEYLREILKRWRAVFVNFVGYASGRAI